MKLYEFLFCIFVVSMVGLIILYLYSINSQEITKYVVHVKSECLDENLSLKAESREVFETNTLACCGVCSLKFKTVFNGKECMALYLDEDSQDYKWFEKIECPFEIL